MHGYTAFLSLFLFRAMLLIPAIQLPYTRSPLEHRYGVISPSARNKARIKDKTFILPQHFFKKSCYFDRTQVFPFSNRTVFPNTIETSSISNISVIFALILN